MTTRYAIIGTAGRDKTIPMSMALWQWMLDKAKTLIPRDAHLVSGGAAWADHIAVALFLEGYSDRLTLHLPAPLSKESGWFIGSDRGSAVAANFYHQKFSKIIGRNSLAELLEAATWSTCDGTFEDLPGYRGMFVRNAKVAQCEAMLAFTFGKGNEPATGGTLDTWNKCQGERLHVSLPYL
jgi:hypothetical protein